MVRLAWLGNSTGYTMSTPISIMLCTTISYFWSYGQSALHDQHNTDPCIVTCAEPPPCTRKHRRTAVQLRHGTGRLTMNLSASAFMRPLLRHVFQIVGSTNPILRVPKFALILNDRCGATSSDSLLVGTIMASMRATRSFADFA
jgi:hypothetical protein